MSRSPYESEEFENDDDNDDYEEEEEVDDEALDNIDAPSVPSLANPIHSAFSALMMPSFLNFAGNTNAPVKDHSTSVASRSSYGSEELDHVDDDDDKNKSLGQLHHSLVLGPRCFPWKKGELLGAGSFGSVHIHEIPFIDQD